MRAFLLVLLLLPLAHAASVSISAGSNYTLEGNTYTVYPLNENATALEQDGRQSILKLKDCLRFNYTESCLTAVTASAATFAEEYTGAIVTATHTLSASSADLGDELSGTVTLKNTGKAIARNVAVTVDLPQGLRLENGGQQYTWSGNVRSSTSFTYTFTAERNGSFNVTGSYAYLNASNTTYAELPRRPLTVTVPLTISISYSPDETQRANFSVTAKKRQAEDYPIEIELTLPPEANVTSVSRGVRERAGKLTLRSDENESQAVLNALYHFTSPPSSGAGVRVTYERAGEDEQELTYNLSFAVQEDSEPSLAVSVDPLLENSSGSLRVTITGNRTGKLWLRGLLDYTTETGAGTQEFTVPGKAAGNYTLSVQFDSFDPYGRPHTAFGTVLVPVEQPKPLPPPVVPEQPPAEQEEPPVAVEPRSFPFVLLAAAACTALLAIAAVMLFHVRDPITKVERLAARVEALRAEVRKRSDASAAEELVQLAVLEEELALLLAELESQSSYKDRTRGEER